MDFSDKAKLLPHPTKKKLKGKGEVESPTVHWAWNSDSKGGLDIDLGKDHSAWEGQKSRKEAKEPSPNEDGE